MTRSVRQTSVLMRHAWALARHHRALIPAFLLASALLGLHAAYYYPFMADDAFISLRYSQRLLEGHGLTWSDGMPVEGYSNLLWVLLCALLALTGIELTLVARILGCLCSMATIAAVMYAVAPKPGARRYDVAPSLVSALMIAGSGSIAAWAVGGLEQALLAALVAWAHAIVVRHIDEFDLWSRKRQETVGVLLGLVAWTRPDGLIFAVAILASCLLVGVLSRVRWRVLARIALTVAAFYWLQLAFRLVYYGEWVANTAHVKLALTKTRYLGGMKYLADGANGLLPLVLLATPVLVGCFARLTLAKRLIVLAASSILWSAYVMAIGGDLFPAHRHLVVLVVLLTLLAGQATSYLCSLRNGLRWTWLTLCTGGLVAYLGLQRMDSDNWVAHAELWEWAAVPVGRLLRQFESKHPVLAADSAGSLVFYSHLPAIDMLGLSDHFIAHHPPYTLGEGTLGHELGNGPYVLSRKPDLVIFLFPTGSGGTHWPSGKQMCQDRRFFEDYRHVVFETDDAKGTRCELYIRREGRIGFDKGSSLTVPGYLLSGEWLTIARLDDSGRMGVVVRKGQPARIDRLPLEHRAHRLTLHFSGEPVDVTATCGERKQVIQGASGVLEPCSDPNNWQIALQSIGDGLSHVRDITFDPI